MRLSGKQKSMLLHLVKLPKAYRVNGGTWITWSVEDSLDVSVLYSLMRLHLVEVSDHGFRLSEDGRHVVLENIRDI